MNYETLKQNCPDWQAYIHHEFVRQLGDGSLPKTSFQHYLRQDYLFLIQFTRAWALAIYKSHSLKPMRHGQAGINAMLDGEIQLHIDYCRNWGIDEAVLLSTPESAALIAYTRYVLDVGMTGTLAELYAALIPCIVGYAEIGQHLSQRPPVADNPYQAWINTYAGEDYQQSATQSREMLDELCRQASPSQLNKLQQIFNTATRMEIAFWQEGLSGGAQ